MSDSVSALDTMFNALLDISRMDAGAVVAEACAFDLESMLHRARRRLLERSRRQGAALLGAREQVGARAARPQRPAAARADRAQPARQRRQVHAPTAACSLTCRLRGGAAGGDRGLGHRPRHPRRPTASASSRSSIRSALPSATRAGGLGLGLSIVRRLAQLLGHPLALRSVAGRGSLLRARAAATTRPTRRAAEPAVADRVAAGGSASRVIDDDPEVRDAMTVAARTLGLQRASPARSADEVLERAGRAAAAVQVLVVDLQLRGGRSGIDAIARCAQARGDGCPR